jgi:glucose-6-phosphate isomerase
MAASDRRLITFDPAGAADPLHGLQPGDLAALSPSLERARQEVLVEDARLYRDRTAPAEKQPLDHGFFELPERLLADYRKDRQQSELGRILATAERLKKLADKVVVLGIGGSYMGAKALGGVLPAVLQRIVAGRPRRKSRIYFEGNNIDNDASQG